MKQMLVVLSILILLFGCAGASPKVESAPEKAPASQPVQPAPIAKEKPVEIKEEMELGKNECFYDSNTSKLACGRKVTVVHQGIEYNVSQVPVKVDICGLAGIVGANQNKSDINDTSDTYLIFIMKNKDQRITLEENTSRKAVGYSMFDEECNSS